jgi:transcriptional regulator with XRE-family HTH domain
MARREWNTTRMAREAGVSDMWISRRLRGKTDFTVSDLDRVARALGVPVDVLLEGRAA